MSKKIGLIQCPAECYSVIIAKSVKNYNKDEQFLYLDGQFVSFSRTKFFGLTLTIKRYVNKFQSFRTVDYVRADNQAIQKLLKTK